MASDVYRAMVRNQAQLTYSASARARKEARASQDCGRAGLQSCSLQDQIATTLQACRDEQALDFARSG